MYELLCMVQDVQNAIRAHRESLEVIETQLIALQNAMRAYSKEESAS